MTGTKQLTALQRIDAELARLEAKAERQRTAAQKTREEILALLKKQRREFLRTQIGKPVRYAFRSGGAFDDAVGTLAKVDRTWCTVQYAEPIKGSKSWRFRVDSVALADEQQGLALQL